jgi:hypothetical protein
MILAIHLILTTLATTFGWDILRRLSPVTVPGVVARVIIAVLATVLWVLCPLNILVGMAVVGALMFVGQFVAVEAHWLWGRAVMDAVLKRKQQTGQQKVERVVKEKAEGMGKSYKVGSKVGKRIPKL